MNSEIKEVLRVGTFQVVHGIATVNGGVKKVSRVCLGIAK